MTLTPIQIQPGLYTETTGRTAVSRWKDGFNIRFFKGNPQKLRGWVKAIAASMQGICRSIIAWTTLSFQRLLGFGTHEKLYLSDGVTFFDITPLDDSGTLGANPFTTTNLSDVVEVSDTAHARDVGDHVTFAGATTVGGLDMNAEWVVDTVIDADHYTFIHDALASASATGGGSAVTYAYDIPPGTQSSVLGSGWGAGGWGTGTWGTPRVSDVLTLARIWSLVTWGEDLIASPLSGAVYVWIAANGTETRASLITQAPAQNRRIGLSPQLRILISFGSHDGTNPDPMLIRWCDSEDYTDWTPSVVNLAGDKRLDNGNEIVSAILSRDEFAIFTDQTLYSMYLTGDNLVFGFQDKGHTVGLAGPNAAVDINGVVYAMGRGEFFTYDGQIEHLPCDVYTRVFGNMNVDQAAKIYCARNKTRNEVIWFYPSASSDEPDMAVMLNYDDNSWSLGDAHFARTAWLDETPFSELPYATAPTSTGSSDSYVYSQETGVDADGAVLPYSLSSYDLELTDESGNPGNSLWKFKRLFPDFKTIVGNHFVTLTGRKKPNDVDIVKGPMPFGATVTHIDGHLRARQISITIAGAEVGNDIEIGGWRADAAQMGER